MTLDDLAQALDDGIEQQLRELEMQIRADLAATAPEDEDARDRPPDPDAGWQPITVEAFLARKRRQLTAWRDATLRRLAAGPPPTVTVH